MILKPNNFNGMDMSKEWKRGDCQTKLWNGVHKEEENEVDLKLPGRKGLEGWWEKGVNGRRLEWQKQLEEEDNCQMGTGRCGNIVQAAK